MLSVVYPPDTHTPGFIEGSDANEIASSVLHFGEFMHFRTFLVVVLHIKYPDANPIGYCSTIH